MNAFDYCVDPKNTPIVVRFTLRFHTSLMKRRTQQVQRVKILPSLSYHTRHKIFHFISHWLELKKFQGNRDVSHNNLAWQLILRMTTHRNRKIK
jgi:hypothetical protein